MSAPQPAAPQRLAARDSIIGTDTRIRRALPHRERRMVGAWCFLDHAGPVRFAAGHGMHVGAHPHIGLQTFTWMIEGEVVHRDSLGIEQVIRPGQVNLMTAGHGIAHSEDSLHDGAALHAAQLWIALPDAERERAPGFRNYPELPRVEQGGFVVSLLAGAACGQRSPVEIYSPLIGLDLTSTGAARTELALDAGFEHAALVLRGAVDVDGEPLGPGTLLYFAPGRSSLELSCDAAAQLLLVGGAPFGEPVLLWWNFVGRTQADMAAALRDWNEGGARFGTVRAGSPAAPLQAPSLEGVRLGKR